jgi:hypothetical protein
MLFRSTSFEVYEKTISSPRKLRYGKTSHAAQVRRQAGATPRMILLLIKIHGPRRRARSLFTPSNRLICHQKPSPEFTTITRKSRTIFIYAPTVQV